MSLPDTVFIFVLALIIFGPKKLPEIGRQLGKLVGEFRRASNEFKFQIEEELRQVELNDRQSNDHQTIAPPVKELDASGSDSSVELPTESAASASSDLPDVEETLPAGQYPNIDNLDPNIDNLDRSDLADLNERLADSDSAIEERTDDVVGEIAPASPTITPAAGTEPRTSFPHSVSEPSATAPSEAAPSSIGSSDEPGSDAASANSPSTANATPVPNNQPDDPYSAPVVADITHG
jgi:TatA/E family protein of Tat protein translocase